jgi:hypothetical protein
VIKFLSLLCALVALCGASSSSANAQGRSSSLGPLRLELTFSNPNTAPIYLVKAGLLIKHLSGSSMCRHSISRMPVSLADYVIEFLVGNKNQDLELVESNPPMEIPANQAKSITIAAMPNSAGMCGPWAIEVTPVSMFSNGTTVYGSKHQLTDADLQKFISN